MSADFWEWFNSGFPLMFRGEDGVRNFSCAGCGKVLVPPEAFRAPSRLIQFAVENGWRAPEGSLYWTCGGCPCRCVGARCKDGRCLCTCHKEP